MSVHKPPRISGKRPGQQENGMDMSVLYSMLQLLVCFFDAVFLHEWNLRWRAKASHSSIVLAANAASVTLLKCMNRTSVERCKPQVTYNHITCSGASRGCEAKRESLLGL